MTSRSSIKHRLLELRAYVLTYAHTVFRRGMKKHNDATAAQTPKQIDVR